MKQDIIFCDTTTVTFKVTQHHGKRKSLKTQPSQYPKLLRLSFTSQKSYTYEKKYEDSYYRIHRDENTL